MADFKKHKIVLKNGEVFEVNGTEKGVHVEYYLDGGKGSLTFSATETQHRDRSTQCDACGGREHRGATT